jgi:peptidoglycan/LPS O-acetylase OafA/YrhL
MQRNFGLDVMRAFSIWLVLLQHAGISFQELNPLRIGVIGVEIFFVLSGFLIGGILIKSFDRDTSFNSLKVFWIRRWFRILPLYYAVLLGKFLFIDSSIGSNIFYYIFFLQNNFYGIQFLTVSWSLVIEEWFYIISPIFLLIIYRIKKDKKKIWVEICLFILLVNIARLLFVLFFDRPYEGINSNVPFRLDTLFIGLLLAFLKYYKFPIYDRLRSKKYFFLGISLLFIYLFLFWFWANIPIYRIDDLLFPRTIGFFVLASTIGLTVPYIENFSTYQTTTVIRKIIFGFITYTSILTYAIYLLHTIVYDYLFYGILINLNWPLRFILTILMTYLAAFIIYTFFEKKILEFRNRITDTAKQ